MNGLAEYRILQLIQKYLDEHAVDYRAAETSVAGDAQANIQAFLKNLDYADQQIDGAYWCK